MSTEPRLNTRGGWEFQDSFAYCNCQEFPKLRECLDDANVNTGKNLSTASQR